MPECVLAGARGSQKKVPVALGLERQMVVNCLVWELSLGSLQEHEVLSTTELLLQFLLVSFLLRTFT